MGFLTNGLSLALGRLSLKPDDVVVDVGGNVGMLSLNMLAAYPHLRFVVQDLPNVILGAEQVRDTTFSTSPLLQLFRSILQYWRTNNPQALAEKRVTLQGKSDLA